MTEVRFTAFFDGACQANPGGTASYGAVIFEGDDRIWECSRLYDPPKGQERLTTNNLAEYLGLIVALDFFLDNDLHREHITVKGDSEMVIEQCFGKRKIKKGIYKPFALEAQKKLGRFDSVAGLWIPRELNSIADGLSKAVLIER